MTGSTAIDIDDIPLSSHLNLWECQILLFYKEVYDTGGSHKGFQNYANNKTFIEPDLISCSQTSIYTLCVWMSDPISVHRHTIQTGHRSAEPDEPDEDTKTDQGSNQTTVWLSSDVWHTSCCHHSYRSVLPRILFNCKRFTFSHFSAPWHFFSSSVDFVWSVLSFWIQ